MSSLSAASMESYGRAYPLLTRLHVLQEIERGYDLVHLSSQAKKDSSSSGGGGRQSRAAVTATSGVPPLEQREALLRQVSRGVYTGIYGCMAAWAQYTRIRTHTYIQTHSHTYTHTHICTHIHTHIHTHTQMFWGPRLHAMTPSTRQRSTTLAVRRTLLGAAGLHKQVARNWLELTDSMRHLGQFDAARVALRNAEQSGASSDVALLHMCRILKDSGQTHQALLLLEPVELDSFKIRPVLKHCQKFGHALPAFLGAYVYIYVCVCVYVCISSTATGLAPSSIPFSVPYHIHTNNDPCFYFYHTLPASVYSHTYAHTHTYTHT